MDIITLVGVAAGVVGTAFTGYFGWKQSKPADKNSGDNSLSRSSESNEPILGKHEENLLVRIRSKGILRVGCLWYPPFVEYVKKGDVVHATGLYPSMFEHTAAKEGIRVEYKILKWDNAISAIENHQVDVVACVLDSINRREKCDLVGALYRIGVGGVVRIDQKKIRKSSDLEQPSLRIAITKGEIGWEYCERYLNLEEDFARYTVIEDTQITKMMQLVSSGDVDIAIADSLSCAQYVSQAKAKGVYLEDIFAFSPLHVEDNCLMIAKDQTEFRTWLSKGFREARLSNEVRKLEERIVAKYPDIVFKVSIP
jgi:ABC-type amino acid transport substrate-binding protein